MTPPLDVLVYNRCLPTLGGGERYSLALASYLARRHRVTVVSREPVDSRLAAARLDVDLDRVRFLTVPAGPDSLMSELSASCDVFINASHGDFTPCRARRGALVVYFPVRPDLDPTATRLHRALKVAAHRALRFPAFETGVYRVDAGPGGLLRTTAGHVAMRFPSARRAYGARLELAALDPAVRQVAVTVGTQPAFAADLPPDGVPVSVAFTVEPGGDGSVGIPVTVETLGQGIDPPAPALSIHGPACDLPGDRLYRALFERWRPALGQSLHVIPPAARQVAPVLATYESIWAISNFARRWVKRYWNADSQLLYPAVSVAPAGRLQTRPRRQQILSVGRFFAGYHNKKHGAMIAAFRRMVGQGLTGWELHLAGGVLEGPTHERYFDDLRRQSTGLPVSLHPDASRETLDSLYAESALYWHAAGLGEDPDSHPERLEHFGMTTVEAMAAGCVPVVIARGGQPEIISDGKDGYLAENADELVAATWRLVRDPVLRDTMSAAAVEASRRFSVERFNQRLQELLDGLEDPS